MISPPLLKKNDTIGVVAPARKIMQKELEPFFRWAEIQGFNIRCGSNLFKDNHQFAGTDRERISDLETMIRDDEVKAIIAARGGYGCGRLLDSLNIRLLDDHPKWIAGFSDITALLAAFNRIAGIETLHAWMPYSIYHHEDFDRDSLKSLSDVLTSGQIRYSLTPGSGSIMGETRGVLTGGNLSVLYSLAGTSYEPDYEGKILLLEDVDEYLYHIDRMILNFEMRGIFDQIAGLIIGSFNNMKDNEIPFGRDARDIIAERAAKHNVPTLFGFPSGHENRNHTLIFGRDVTLSIRKEDALLTS